MPCDGHASWVWPCLVPHVACNRLQASCDLAHRKWMHNKRLTVEKHSKYRIIIPGLSVQMVTAIITKEKLRSSGKVSRGRLRGFGAQVSEDNDLSNHWSLPGWSAPPRLFFWLFQLAGGHWTLLGRHLLVVDGSLASLLLSHHRHCNLTTTLSVCVQCSPALIQGSSHICKAKGTVETNSAG